MKQRTFLFLQGPTSPFFSHMGDKLLNCGAKVLRVNFNLGDAIYWRNKPSWQFRQDIASLPEWLEEKLIKYNISDIIMFGDTRPVNAPAVPLAKRHNIRLHVLEEGYLRPNFLTIEEGGVNGFSTLPKDPRWYSQVGPNLPELPEIEKTVNIANPIAVLALHEIGYHLPGLLNFIFFPYYKTHRPFISPVELFGWARRLSIMPWYKKRDATKLKQLIDSGQKYFMLPLQLGSDSQIKTHSPFKSVTEVIQTTLKSFAMHAPNDSLIIIKNHPLDTGFANFKKIIKKYETQLGLKDRTLYIESGHLPSLLDHCEGCVVVNSTVGTSALIHNCRTLTLSNPVYNIAGLTATCSLDEFWSDNAKPDRKLLNYFRRVVIHTTQINGGFYSKKGIEVGINSSIERLMMQESRLQELFVQWPLLTKQLKPCSDRKNGVALIKN